jgi:CRISPR system Cascade subunit CasB
MTAEIRNATAKIIHELYGDGDGSQNKAVLSSFRSSASFSSPRARATWPVIMANLDDRQLSRTGVPSKAEIAVFTAVRLYALNQQGKTNSVYGPSKNDKDNESDTLFTHLAAMNAQPDRSKSFNSLVQRVLNAPNIDGVINGLSHLVGQIKSDRIERTIDYAQLAQDLYNFQFSFESANRVQLRWGQEYYRTNTPLTDKKETEQND